MVGLATGSVDGKDDETAEGESESDADGICEGAEVGA